MKKDVVNIEISIKSLLLITVFVVLLVLVWELRLVFVLIFLAFIIKSALRPYVDYFETKRIPRIVSTISIYLFLFIVLSLITVTLFSETIVQLKNLFLLMPEIIANILREFISLFPWLEDVINLDQIKSIFVDDITNVSQIFSTGVSSAVTIINSAFSAIAITIAILTVSVYMLVRKKEVYSGVLNIIPIKQDTKENYVEVLEKVEFKLGSWMRAQLFLMAFIGVLTWVGLSLPALFIDSYHMQQYALPIAFVAAVMEAIPSIGPVLTAGFAIIVAIGSGSSFGVVIYIVLLFVGIQQLEGLVVVPKLMERVIGLDPILTIVSAIGAFLLFGLMGAILVIPVLAVLQIVLDSELEKYNKRNPKKAS